MAYGGSIAGLANNELAENQQRMQFSRQVGDRQAQLTAQQRRDAELLLEHMIQQQRDAQQQRNFDRSMTSREGEVRDARTERAREFDARQKAVDAGQAQQSRYYDWLMKQQAPGDQKQYQSRMNGALMNAQSGKYGDWREVMDDFPDMQPEDASVVLGQSHAARSQMQSSYDFANNAAGVLNKLTNLKQQLALKNKEVVKRGGFHAPWSSSPGFIYSSEADVAKVPGRYDSEIPKITEEIGKLEPWAQRLQTDKRLDSLLQQDPETGRWQPTQQLPWMPRPGTAALSRPVTTEPTVPKPIIIENDRGQQMILRNGRWEPL